MSDPQPRPNDAPARRGNIISIFVCAALLGVFGLTSIRAAADKSPTYDETLHLVAAWIQTHHGDFRCDPEDPALWKYYAVIGTSPADLRINPRSPFYDQMLRDYTAQWSAAKEILYQIPGNDPDRQFAAARKRMALIGVMLGVTIAWWSWRLAGHWAAMIATAAFSLDPNFLAHSALVKNDVPVTLALMLFMAALWLIGERATLARCIAVGVLVGVAITIKLSGIAAVPILLIALACRIWIAGDWPILKWMARSRLEKFAGAAAILAAAGLLAYLSIWAVYQFRFAPTPDGQGEFDLNHLLKVRAAGEYIVANHLSWNSSIDPQWMAAWKPDPAIRLIQWMDHRRLFPQSWLFGLLYTDATALVRREFLCGDYRLTGWWYYFPLAIVFKTPLTTLIAVILSLAYGGWQVTRTKARQYGWALCAGAILPLTYLCLAMNSNLDVGFRHVLPIYPFLFILIGVAAIAARRRWPRTITAVGVALLAGLSVETFMAYPNFIPFFNVAAGGERGGLKLLTDSNIDWGQDLPALALWQKEHADRQLYLCYFGTADPRFYGIHYINLPGSEAAPDELTPTGKPIAIAISATELQGTYQTDEQRQRYVALRDRSPAAVLGGSIYIYLPGSGKP